MNNMMSHKTHISQSSSLVWHEVKLPKPIHGKINMRIPKLPERHFKLLRPISGNGNNYKPFSCKVHVTDVKTRYQTTLTITKLNYEQEK